MSSRFVSAGTIAGDGSPSEAASQPPRPETAKAQWDSEPTKKSSEWEAVQRDLEADRKRREEARKAQVEGGPGGEKSLYDILQANKAAKQAAFEDQNRIRNQFRALDDEEIDFLDGVRDERRVEEERMKRETEERLASFREAQKAAGTAADVPDAADDGVGGGGDDVAVAWTGAGKKRKRGEKEVKSIVKGVKRKNSEPEKESHGAETSVESTATKKSTTTPASTGQDKSSVAETAQGKTTVPNPKPTLGLVDYGSDEDDD
ncbi:hypothetical protein M426DRAFT_324807 [Hypoxylon sp. CI-4A]|nr:hypothetical protein M426DRAFT_324807 [Hypoxylon sp. CI-4A]